MFEKFKDQSATDEQESAGETPISEQDELAVLEANLAEANDLLLRRTAEMENMRRRHQQERTQLIFDANKRLIAELLGTIDDLERTLASVKPEERNPLVDGIELVYKNFMKVLEHHHVAAIESVGKPFDVHLHDALMEEARTDLEPGTVTTEVQKGYTMNNEVLRHAKVIVSKSPDEA